MLSYENTTKYAGQFGHCGPLKERNAIFLYIILSRFCKNIWSGTNFAKIHIWRRGPRRQGHNPVGRGARCRQEWALTWPRPSVVSRGVRGLTPWAAALGLSATAHGGSMPLAPRASALGFPRLYNTEIQPKMS
jgi:hypothetical protein